MKVDNPLSHEFVTRYPGEAARVLEPMPVEQVAALCTALPPSVMAPVLAAMLPSTAAGCVDRMDTTPAVRLLSEMSVAPAARIYRLMDAARRETIAEGLAARRRARMHRYLEQLPASAGALMDSRVSMLPETITVADALRRLESPEQAAGCELYVIDQTHRLVGVIEIGSLLRANHHARLHELMSRRTHAVSSRAALGALLTHPGWSSRRRLPVVERDSTLVGELSYTAVQEAAEASEGGGRYDPLDNMLSLAGLYWLSVAQLLNSMLSIARPAKREEK